MWTVATSDRGHTVKISTDKTRDAGFETETNDCFVHALRHVLGVPYRDAHAYAARQFNRKHRQGTHSPDKVLNAMAADKALALGYRVFDTGIKFTGTTTVIRRSRRYGARLVAKFTYLTLSATMGRFSKGRFLVSSCNHAWAVIDGVVYDNGPLKSGRTTVAGAWEFVPSSQCEGR